MIEQTELITVAGSQRFLGGFVYNASYTQGYNGVASNLNLDIVNETGEYDIPLLSYKVQYPIELGSDLSFNLYAYKYCKDSGDGGKILRVSFKDGIDRFNRYWIGLKSLFVGTSYDYVIPLGQTLNDLLAKNLLKNQFDHYSYDEFQAATAFLGIPKIPSNSYLTVNLQGTVLTVFNFFMEAYGYTWYLDASDQIQLIDIKRPILLNTEVVSVLEAHPKKLSSQNCVDISDNTTRGVVAIDSSEYNTNIISTARPLWEGQFLGVPFKVQDGDACVAATISKELYFSYMVLKYGWLEALRAIGFKIKEVIPFADPSSNVNITPDLSSIFQDLYSDTTSFWYNCGSTTPREDLAVAIYQDFENKDATEFDIASKMGELLKNKLYVVTNSFVDLDVNWEAGNASVINPEGTIPQSVSFWDTLDFEKVISVARKGVDVAKVKDLTPADVYIVQFTDSESGKDFIYYPYGGGANAFVRAGENPNSFIGVGEDRRSSRVSNDFYTSDSVVRTNTGQGVITTLNKTAEEAIQEQQAKAMLLMPMAINFPASRIRPDAYKDPSYKCMILNKSALKDISFYLPNYSCLRRSVKGVGTLKPKIQDSIYNVGTKRILGRNIPPINERTSNIEISTYDIQLQEGININQFLSQSAFSQSQNHETYLARLRGLSLGRGITPSDGLNAIDISYGEEGYTTAIKLSTQFPKIRAPEVFRSRFPIN